MSPDFKRQFTKQLEFTFGRSTLEREATRVRDSLVRLLAEIDNEAELIATDNLAKGNLIHLTDVFAFPQKTDQGQSWWQIDTSALQCSVESLHPPEYWGSVAFPSRHLISKAVQFPWMPAQISRPDFPF